MRRPRIALAAFAIAVAGLLCASGASAAPAPRVTLIGDSVQASFEYVPAATARLGKGLDLKLDARVCRRLVIASCSYRGATPTTALGAVRGRTGAALGRVIVVNVGYNEGAATYDVGAVVRAARAKGVRRVVWVTLRDPEGTYGGHNARIRAAARRSSAVVIADWDALSRGRPWFASDGLHLNRAGAMALAGLLRTKVLAALRATR